MAITCMIFDAVPHS